MAKRSQDLAPDSGDELKELGEGLPADPCSVLL